ncbi:MAG: regulatory protein RecX [Clostridia bacterium]|nr:regulatory protein RecX [Clostridia bacterium]
MKITDVTPQQSNKNRVSVFVDGEYSFSLDGADALRLGVKTGAQITEKDIEIYNLESNLSKAKAKAFDIVARKMVTENELRTKLTDKGYDGMICDIVIETMREYNYINDADYCVSFFDYAVSKGWGKIKIRAELKRRGVDESTVSAAMAEYDDCPEQRIYDLLCRKFTDADLKDYKQKQKVLRFFASRGFDFDSIQSAVSRFISEKGEDI